MGSNRCLLVALLVVLGGLLGATCENQDYYLPQRLEIIERAVFEPEIRDITLPYQGLNSLDFLITNTGEDSDRFGLAVSVCTEDAPEACSSVDAARLAGLNAELEPGEELAGHLTETELGLGDRVHVEFHCYDDDVDSDELCSGTASLVLLLRQVECRVESECSSDETCDVPLGICRKIVDTEQGCRQVSNKTVFSKTGTPASWLLLAFALLITSRRRTLALMVAIALLVTLVARVGIADPPSDFRRTQVYVHPSFQLSRFVGTLSDSSSLGAGMAVTQGIQFGYFGFNLTIDTDYFLTSQEPPPFNRGLQIASARVAARFVYPFGDIRLYGEGALRRIGLISNTLVDLTGPNLNYHSIGGALGIRLLHLSPLYFELRTNWDYLIDMSDSSILGLDIGFGIRSVL